jgi:hypothetical protein
VRLRKIKIGRQMTTKREGALGGYSVAQEIHRGLPKDTFLSVDDSAKMAQLLEKRLQVLNVLPHGAAGDNDFFLYIFRGFCVYVPLPPYRGQHTVLCHPRWLPTSGLTEFAMCWGGARF